MLGAEKISIWESLPKIKKEKKKLPVIVGVFILNTPTNIDALFLKKFELS